MDIRFQRFRCLRSSRGRTVSGRASETACVSFVCYRLLLAYSELDPFTAMFDILILDVWNRYSCSSQIQVPGQTHGLLCSAGGRRMVARALDSASISACQMPSARASIRSRPLQLIRGLGCLVESIAAIRGFGHFVRSFQPQLIAYTAMLCVIRPRGRRSAPNFSTAPQVLSGQWPVSSFRINSLRL